MGKEHSGNFEGILQFFDISDSDYQLLKIGKKPFVDFIPTGASIFCDHNVITDGGDQRIAELVGGLDTNAVTIMAIGDGGVSPGDQTVPLAPTKADVALGNEVKQDTIASTVLVTVPDYQVQFSQVFFTNDPGLGVFLYSPRVINEAGLFTTDGVLFARKTWVPLPFEIVDRTGIIASWSIHVL